MVRHSSSPSFVEIIICGSTHRLIKEIAAWSSVRMSRDTDTISTNGSKHGWPTRKNILFAMRWLVSDLQPGDSLFFHYSGHGGRTRDVSGDEADGFDSTLLPMDWKRAGAIVDDEINSTLIRPLIPGVRLHAVVDACHSGTVMDLQYSFVSSNVNGERRQLWVDNLKNKRINKNTNGGTAICFSSSSDAQVSADTTMYTGTNIATGACTYAFINAIEKGKANSYGELLYNMQLAVHPRGREQAQQQQNLLADNRAKEEKKKKRNGGSILKQAGQGVIGCFASIAAPGGGGGRASSAPPPIRPIAQDIQLSSNAPFDLKEKLLM